MRISVVIILIAFTGCATLQQSPVRFYNLTNGETIIATINDFYRGYGKISAAMSNGELLEGVYSLNNFSDRFPLPPYRPFQNDDRLGMVDSIKKNSAPFDWSTEYGYSSNAKVSPVGTATLVGKLGTVVEIVFFAIDFRYEYGDGIARDNKGNKYRVYIGKIRE
ncbi:MAG: hypothetical protein KGZ58_10250 [Ignavibacteriales bacterium]|nr:hypothetical protein [Ignavibacteriales bacterium]